MQENAGLILPEVAVIIRGMDDWDRVIAAVIDRRAELGLTQERLAAEANVAVRTIRSLERGEAHPQPVTRRKIEKALGWKPGEFRRIENENGGPQDDPRDLAIYRAVLREQGEEDAAAVLEFLRDRRRQSAP